MKYVMFKRTMRETTHFMPVIFSEMMAHSEVAEALLAGPLKEYEVHSAGDFSSVMFTGEVSGRSATLNKPSDPKDTRRISRSDYDSFE